MHAQKALRVGCRSCGEESVVRSPVSDGRVQFVCDHCGYMANFSVAHIRKSRGAQASVDDARRTGRGVLRRSGARRGEES